MPQDDVAAPTGHEFVVVSNRLPVDRVTDENGNVTWRTSPGGLVTAMEPVVRDLGCVWVGWPGSIDEHIEPFTVGGTELLPVSLDATEFAEYYEGFSNDTIWPLYHDVISPPGYHREWWDRYVSVNQRFADAAASVAAQGATVWVHDYQLQLVPGMLRELRPDLVIAFFLHIPWPSHGLFGQLPWRRKVLQGLLGADVIGFQRVADAANFRSAVRRFVGAPSNGNMIVLSERPATRGRKRLPARRVLAQEFPISIDAEAFAELAASESVRLRARQIREELGNPEKIILGVDRLDYTKGIRHRLKAFSELLRDGEVKAGDVTLVQVASPSRERVEAYQHLRDEIEVTVGRINGDYGTIAHSPVVYLHRGYPREEMAALYLAADVLAVTALRDGMNLVAKEYAACRSDEQGVLVLSEFAGAADELRRALLVNPHDIDGMKAAFMEALRMSETEQRQRMRAMRRVIFRADVARWSEDFLRSVEAAAEHRRQTGGDPVNGEAPPTSPIFLPRGIDAALRRLAAEPQLLIACDFDGTLAPIVTRPEDARILPRAEQALAVLQDAPGVQVALISGRSVESLAETGVHVDGRIIAGSHGAELVGLPSAEAPVPPEPGDAPLSDAEPRWGAAVAPSESEREQLGRLMAVLEPRVAAVPGAWIEEKPLGAAVHVRQVQDPTTAENLLLALENETGSTNAHGLVVHTRSGKSVLEFSVREADKGSVLRRIREALPEGPTVFIGDDVTDEDALRALGAGDLGVRVGSADSVAEYRVADPEEVAALLARLAELRTGVVVGSEYVEYPE
ncbi:trehalose-6-phosphate synthase [Leucobacter sp. CSA1]|uniref:Glucosylglycerol-phosphate synthase n=1 Tax=Leucobacter chromiisoli TaxID=2796471 RepID=A0A934QAC5_9MICO|nr:trehalose-6-phosphate synthase [Leucobacter chromiisoli]MBK0420091.1 trehalose-6-phosphate synthase [Leucobacter chromiisoli]